MRHPTGDKIDGLVMKRELWSFDEWYADMGYAGSSCQGWHFPYVVQGRLPLAVCMFCLQK